MINYRAGTTRPGRRRTARIVALAASLGMMVVAGIGMMAIPAAASTPATMVHQRAEDSAALSQAGNLVVAAICIAVITAVGAVVIWYTARARRTGSE